MIVPPFLTLEQPVDYLYEREYFSRGTISEDHKQRLAHLNFHYFLGYARNYRALVGRGTIERSLKAPDDVLRVVDYDMRVSTALHSALRAVEWRLRATAVRHYCQKFDPAASFLSPRQFRETEPGSANLIVQNVLMHIFRHDEPYVKDRLREIAEVRGVAVPKSYEKASHELCVELASVLPLWAVIDSFSLGLLGHFIMCCDTDREEPVWREVANDLGISARVFETQIKSLAYLRNLVAHHARLWRRPTVDSPRAPKIFKARLRDTDNKSMYWAFLNLATFLPSDIRMKFADELDALVKEDDLYHYGVTRVGA